MKTEKNTQKTSQPEQPRAGFYMENKDSMKVHRQDRAQPHQMSQYSNLCPPYGGKLTVMIGFFGLRKNLQKKTCLGQGVKKVGMAINKNQAAKMMPLIINNDHQS